LVSRGSCTFVIKGTLAKAAGAVGTIVYNNVEDVIAGSGEAEVGPIVSIPLSNGNALVAQLKAGTVVTARVKVDISSIKTYATTFCHFE
jgi:hypothetical protein